MTELDRLEFETLLQDDGLILARGRAERVLIMTPISASADAAARIEHFYSLREDLDASWALRPTSLRHWQGSPVLVTTDPGGQPLATLLGAPLELSVFLRIATGIASALAHCHGKGLIHRDIKPSSILVQPSSGIAWLSGLGRASRTPRQRQAPEPPHIIAGTLAYMAPEQTGRMNRSIDSRSDLYAFGVLLYEMLVGEVPFTSTDPMEVVHCHLARRPVPPHERATRIPIAVSALVLKLLAKVAEDRYQTAAGVEADLRSCLAQWQAIGEIQDFTLGTADVSDSFSIPEKLYGREREIEQLLAAFDHVVQSGRPGLMLVAGYSGVGKSSVVNELHKALLPPRGQFASGKFDQYKRDIPYATLAQAFQRLVATLLVEPEAELARYRQAILGAIEPYGQLVVNLVPELEGVIGKQPAPAELAPQDAPRVFEQVLRRFIGVFARPEHPLALFLDDLQWLDAATLDLIEHLLLQDEVRSLFLVGAYRDNEVGPEHPLARRLDTMRKAGASVSEIVLAPLGLSDVTALIAETLHNDQVDALAELVHTKTAGNPFFASQFLTALADDGLIAFETRSRSWTWHAASIAARSFTDSVVTLMLGKIARLPAACRDAMQILACLGNAARVESLATALNLSGSALGAALGHAVHAGLVAQQDGRYAFLHDRVQEAAYASIAEPERAALHLRIGRRLVAAAGPDRMDQDVFEMVGQFNRGIELVRDRDELDAIAELNLRAGRRAKAATAYVTALAFFRTGARLVLGGEGGERRRALSFALDFEQGESEFLTGDLELAEPRLSALVARANGRVELAALTCVRILLYATRGDPTRAVAVCLEYLEHDGIHLKSSPSREDVESELERMWSALGDRSIEDLARLPETTDAATLATLEVLTAAASPAFWIDQLLPVLLAVHTVRISIERGNNASSSYGFVLLATKLGPFAGDYQAGYRFGKLALELAERGASSRTLARVLYAHTMYVRPWADTLGGWRELLNRAFEAAERAGDLTYATYILCNACTMMLLAGSPLEETEAACRRALEYAGKLSFEFMVVALRGPLGLMRMLRGDTVRFGSFDTEEFDEATFEGTYAAVPALAIAMFWYWTRRQQAQFLAGDARRSMAAADAAEPLLWCADVYPEFAEHHFFAALARAECLHGADEVERPKLRERLEANARAMATFAENSPVTFGCRAKLIAAELARVDGREREAMDFYEQAIRSASAANFVHIEALGFELAARFYASRGFQTIAGSYRRDARAGYERWGARGKVRQLEELFPELRESVPHGGTINAPVELLDLSTVLKISETVSGEIVLPKLIEKLMRIALEHAGADRGLLVRAVGDELYIDAEATTGRDGISVRLVEETTPSTSVPESVLRYVVRAREAVIVDDASVHNLFTGDECLQMRSLLCLPLVKQATLAGVLYLENSLAPHVFTPARVSVLRLLASQAAISLENARLYQSLAAENRERQRAEEALRRSEALLAGAQRVSRTGSWGWNTANGKLVWSEETYRLLGYEHDAPLQPDVYWPFRRVHPEDLQAVKELLGKAVASGADLNFEHRVLLPDGSVKNLRVVAQAGKSELGELEYIGASMDVTVEHQARIELEKAFEDVHRSQIELAHVTRVATLGELAASIAHEVNQPLSSMIADAGAGLRWLAKSNLDRVAESFAAVISAGERAHQVLTRIRAFLAQTPVAVGPCELSAVVAAVIPIVRGQVRQRAISFETQLSTDLPAVVGDAIQLQQVVLNLLLNAVEATQGVPEERRRVIVRSSVEWRDECPWALLAVEDAGVGVAEGDVLQLFKPFHTTKQGGLGMGLAISRSIIDRHGGRLWASRNAEHGTTFHLALPGIRPGEGLLDPLLVSQ